MKSLSLIIASFLLSSSVCAAPVIFCELASLPVLPLASDLNERLSPEELLSRVAESYRGLLEFGGEALLRDVESLEDFFEPVTGRDQRNVALNESLTKLGDWVTLEAEEHGLTQELILVRLREVVRNHLREANQEQERVQETREEQMDVGRQTATGHIFYRDTRFPELGEAWIDPDGMVWGDVVKNGDQLVRQMNHAEALEYCQSIGAELPNQEDFIRLREYMGAQPGSDNGYKPQILPGLRRGLFWTSSDFSGGSNSASSFNGSFGFVCGVSRDLKDLVRCVRRVHD